MIVFVTLVFPIGSMIFLYKKRSSLDSEDMKARYGTLYLNIRVDNPITLISTLLFLLRRLLFALSLVFISDAYL